MIRHGPALHLERLLQIRVRGVNHLTAGEFTPRDTVMFANLHHIVHAVAGQVVDGDDTARRYIDVLEAEVDVGRAERVDVEPNVAGPAVADEVLVLVLVAADVACDVGGLEGDVRVLVEAGASSDGVVEYHDVCVLSLQISWQQIGEID